MGRLDEVLSHHNVVAVDTAPFIYLWERHPRYLNLAEALFRHLKQPQVEGVTSIVTLIEACVHSQREGRADLVEAYERSLLYSQQIRTLPIDATLARRAVMLRAAYEIHVPDALQLSAAIEPDATLFVTNDRRLSKIQEVKVLLFDDHA